jgi:nucleoside-diphosphate-sugar epimerase
VHGPHLVLANLYGPGDRSGHAIPSLIYRLLHAVDQRESEVLAYGSSRAAREFLYVEDAAEGIVQAVLRDVTGRINLTTAAPASLGRVVEYLAALCGYYGEVHWEHDQALSPRMPISHAKAHDALGWAPTTPLLTGLAKTVEWAKTRWAQDPEAVHG